MGRSTFQVNAQRRRMKERREAKAETQATDTDRERPETETPRDTSRRPQIRTRSGGPRHRTPQRISSPVARAPKPVLASTPEQKDNPLPFLEETAQQLAALRYKEAAGSTRFAGQSKKQITATLQAEALQELEKQLLEQGTISIDVGAGSYHGSYSGNSRNVLSPPLRGVDQVNMELKAIREARGIQFGDTSKAAVPGPQQMLAGARQLLSNPLTEGAGGTVGDRIRGNTIARIQYGGGNLIFGTGRSLVGGALALTGKGTLWGREEPVSIVRAVPVAERPNTSQPRVTSPRARGPQSPEPSSVATRRTPPSPQRTSDTSQSSPQVSRDVAEVILQTDGSVREVNNPEIDTRQKVPTRNVSSRTVAEDLRAIAEGEKLIAVGSGSKRIGSGQVVASVRDMLASQVQNKQGLPPVNNPNVVDDNFRELVSRFQAEYAADNGLPSSFVDGLFGKATLTALNDARNPVPDAGVGTTQGTGERKSNVEEVILTPEGTATTRNNPEYETRGEDLSLNHSTNQASEDLSLVAAGRKTLAAGPGKKRIGSAPVIAEVRAMLGELVTNGYISGDGLSPSQNPIQADDNFKELVTRFQTQYAADKGLGNSFVDGLFGPKTLAALRQVSSETSRPVSEHIQGPGGWTEQTTTEIDDRLSYKSLVLPKVNPES